MRYTKYITAIVTFFIAGACAVADLDEQSISVGTTGTDAVKVMGSVTRFSDYNVGTRGAKTGDEAKVTSMALAVFPINAAGDGVDPCVSYYFMKSSDPLFTIVRDEENVEIGKKYALYIFANMPQMDFDDTLYGGNSDDIYTEGVGKTLDELLSISHNVKGVDIPDEGFPMMGSLGDYFSKTTDDTLVGDGNEFVLYPAANALPTVNGAPTDLLNIPMKALYAKMVFTIKVTADQVLEGKYPPQFSLEGWQVHNVPNSLDFKSDTPPIGFIEDPAIVTDDNGSAVGASTVSFSFYLPERYLTPDKSGADVYPDELKEGTVREEDKKYLQRFKPLLVEGQEATYVTFTGNFRDHRNENYQVSYDIYVGKDNYANFDVERNCQYNNYITIRGITTAKDQVDAENKVAIDHRVTVTERDPIILNLRRETLLDSHFEVRPLRLRAADGSSTYSDVKVEILNAEFPDDETKIPTWIRLEHMTGNAGNSTLHLESGKRKYFTYGLVTGKDASGNTEQGNISANTSQTLSVGGTDEIVWIYVDECGSDDKGDGVRSAIVRVSYTVDGTLYQEDFIINQRLLFPVTYTNNTAATDDDRSYLIEYHEEYLYNYDAEDSYGQTEEEGMAWGLNGVQLSFDKRSLVFDTSYDWINSIVNWLAQNAINPYYDFYISTHDKINGLTMRDQETGNNFPYMGYTFSNEIIADSNDSARIDAQYAIGVRDLSSKPDSAVEYCYNKNKRDANGNVASVKWYLPAINEVEDIIKGDCTGGKAYARFPEFQNKYYWSSQPAYINNYTHYSIIINTYGELYYDNPQRSRATKIQYTNGEYNNVNSGGTGYYSVVLIEGWNSEDAYIYTVTGDNFSYNYDYWSFLGQSGHSIGTVAKKWSNAEGSQLRTKKNRIRCVYKQ